jgi:hypothetical protein
MNAYLKRSIAAILMSMSLGHTVDAIAAEASRTDAGWLATVHVVAWDNPFDVANDAFDWTIADYDAWDVGMSGDPGDSGGGGDYQPIPSPCAELRERKPPSCPNPIPMPNGYDYGRGEFPGGSGLARLLYWIDHFDGVDAVARDAALRGLSNHTLDLRQFFVSGDRANERLLLSVQAACNLQHAADQQNPYHTQNPFGTPEFSPAEARCLEVLELLQAESGDQGFRAYFRNWLDREGIHLDDLGIPESVIEWMSPSNSLRIRYTTVTADAQCAAWWIDAAANQCTF